MNFNRLTTKILLIILTYFTLTTNSFAYIDPGLGSMLVQGLLVVIGAITTFFYVIREKIKNLIKKIFKKKDK